MINFAKQYSPEDYKTILTALRIVGVGLTQEDCDYDASLDWYENRVFYEGSSTPRARRNLIPFAVAILRHLAFDENPAQLEKDYKDLPYNPFSLHDLHRVLGNELRRMPIGQDAPPDAQSPPQAGETAGFPNPAHYTKAPIAEREGEDQ